jgi:hypothetical protein
MAAKQFKPSLTGLSPEVFDVPSASGQNCVSEEFSSDCLHASSERYSENSASEGGMSLHDDGSPPAALRSSYSVNLEALDNVIADEHYKKVNYYIFF